MKDKKYYIRNEETGELEEVTKEEHKAYTALYNIMRNRLRDSLIDKGIGRVFIVGTGRDVDSSTKDFKEIFHNPFEYDLIKFNKDE